MNNTGRINSRPYLRSLDVLKKSALRNGYTETFVYGQPGLISASDKTAVYQLDQVKVISTMRFEADGDSSDHAELYIIETPDGRKGTFEMR